jgi:hypothetical protein
MEPSIDNLDQAAMHAVAHQCASLDEVWPFAGHCHFHFILAHLIRIGTRRNFHIRLLNTHIEPGLTEDFDRCKSPMPSSPQTSEESRG